MAHVDLIPIRAGMAKIPEDRDFTAIQERLSQFSSTRQAGTTTPRIHIANSPQIYCHLSAVTIPTRPGVSPSPC